MNHPKDIIETLNDLIQIHNDRMIGYEHAIQETKKEDSDLKVLFATMIAESHKSKLALATEVQTLRGEIQTGSSKNGKIYRVWMDLKAVLTGHDRHTILENCEQLEDATRLAYKSALEQDFLPAYLRQMIAEQQKSLRASYEEIRAVREQYAESRLI